MLKTIDLINRFDLIDRERYADMIKQVNIPDFTKCIAQFSGLSINELDDDIIAEYLMIWAEKKYRFFKMLGNKIKIDRKFSYKRLRSDISDELEKLYDEFPLYYHWLYMCRNLTANKIDIDKFYFNRYEDSERKIRKLFNNVNINGMKITHFFKNYLNAPESLINALAAIFENDKIEANHTLSIDPIDMMLASENPYEWNSCYRLEIPNVGSHADGCLASILDNSTVISYLWTKEGKFNLYNKYDFKNIRYMTMRRWASISPSCQAIHFNVVYPGKYDLPDELNADLRNEIEEIVARYLKKPNIWQRNSYCSCERAYDYGYDEYNSSYIYTLKQENEEELDEIWNVFNTLIPCPKRYKEGKYLYGVGGNGDDDQGEYRYNGEGFISDNITESYWCPEADDWCSYGHCDCETCEEWDCWCWRNNHPTCSLDNDLCEQVDYDIIEDGTAHADEDYCYNCPRWKACHGSNEEEVS